MWSCGLSTRMPCMQTSSAERQTRWTRRAQRRWVAGVASGISDHASVPAWVVRLGFVVATPIGGLGPIAYAFLWWLLPRDDLPESAAQRTARRFPQAPLWLGVALVAGGLLLFTGQLGWLQPSVVLAIGLIAIGALLFLRGPDDHEPSLVPGLAHAPTVAAAPGITSETNLPPASLPASSRRLVRRREHSFLGPLTLGVGLLLAAIAALLELSDVITFSLAQAAALLLLVIGVGMAVGGFVGRARWLVVPALAIAPFALVLTVLHVDLSDGFGDPTVTVVALDEPVERRLAGGDMTVDLIDLRRGESGTIRVHVGAGMMTLNIPDDITVDLSGSVGVGTTQHLYSRITRGGTHSCCRFTEARGGLAQPIRWVATPRGGTTPGIVRIEATVSVGAIRINHVDRSNDR